MRLPKEPPGDAQLEQVLDDAIQKGRVVTVRHVKHPARHPADQGHAQQRGHIDGALTWAGFFEVPVQQHLADCPVSQRLLIDHPQHPRCCRERNWLQVPQATWPPWQLHLEYRNAPRGRLFSP